MVRIKQFDWSVTGSYFTYGPPRSTYESGIMWTNLIGQLEILVINCCVASGETFCFQGMIQLRHTPFNHYYCRYSYFQERLLLRHTPFNHYYCRYCYFQGRLLLRHTPFNHYNCRYSYFQGRLLLRHTPFNHYYCRYSYFQVRLLLRHTPFNHYYCRYSVTSREGSCSDTHPSTTTTVGTQLFPGKAPAQTHTLQRLLL